MGSLKIVVRYKDGKILKGTTNNFTTTGTAFHLFTIDGDAHDPVTVRLDQLKSVFFVESFEGNPNRKDAAEPAAGDHVSGRKVTVRFTDGETLTGGVMDFNPSGVGFFLFPADRASNNQKIFVINSAVVEVEDSKDAA